MFQDQIQNTNIFNSIKLLIVLLLEEWRILKLLKEKHAWRM